MSEDINDNEKAGKVVEEQRRKAEAQVSKLLDQLRGASSSTRPMVRGGVKMAIMAI